MDNIRIVFQAHKSLKDRMLAIVYNRKINEKPNQTLKDVAIELIEKALELPEYQKSQTPNP